MCRLFQHHVEERSRLIELLTKIDDLLLGFLKPERLEAHCQTSAVNVMVRLVLHHFQVWWLTKMMHFVARQCNLIQYSTAPAASGAHEERH